jgi:hypothetical protein
MLSRNAFQRQNTRSKGIHHGIFRCGVFKLWRCLVLLLFDQAGGIVGSQLANLTNLSTGMQHSAGPDNRAAKNDKYIQHAFSCKVDF